MEILQSHAEYRDIPVIALSANAMRSDVARATETGFRRYITKPIDIPFFLAVLEEVLTPEEKDNIDSSQ
jgi:CheY-like chemotaxis protein